MRTQAKVCRTSWGSKDSFARAAMIIGCEVSFQETMWDYIMDVFTTDSETAEKLRLAHNMLTEVVGTHIDGQYTFVNKYTEEEIKAECAS